MASVGKKRRSAPVKHSAADYKKKDEDICDVRNKDDVSDDDMESEEYSSDEEINEEIQVEFEALPPIDSDFNGIKRLLQQLFLKAQINMSELINLVISQNYIGSIIKQSTNDLVDEADDNDDDDDDIFGFMSVINITDKKDVNCIKQIISLITEQCSKCGSESDIDECQKIFNDDTRPVGLLLNERFINVPAQIALPQHQSLQKDLKDAIRKGMKYSFEYFVMICKSYKELPPDERGGGEGGDRKGKKKGKKKKNKKVEQNKSGELQFSNPEDEFFLKEAALSFSYPISQGDSDSLLAGSWSFDDAPMKPYRTVIFVKRSKIQTILTKMQEELSI
ncbi:protein BCCIP homolog [Saccoglossus kowalevskii]|uniref:Protein BCCIP homolog n=1 Tax=Saccoglossus kowalevskii TaxID=10224 RepID=A0ABM0GNR2_SACKO|nr:PREDICTED: BRCA2 and CDKN1A-interacting protein-like [Saccoglossus kowalevskii]